MKILVPVDGSAYSKKALAYLAAHDEWLGAHHRYTLLHVLPAIPPHAAKAVGKEALQTYYDEEAAKVFKPLRSFFSKAGLNVDYVSRVGHAADEIGKLADKGDYDLVIMGSHGHGSLGALVLGSVVNKVLAKSSRPLLIVR
jgi:nucleotide-binding universal stress UspA family protein